MMDKATFLRLLGQRIIELRSEKNWSQSDLAHACEKDRQSIDRLERGKVNPSAYYLKEVANALEMPLSRLLEL